MKDGAFLFGLGQQDLEDEGDVANKAGNFPVPVSLNAVPLLETRSRWSSPTAPRTGEMVGCFADASTRRSSTRDSLLAKSLSREIAGNWSHTTLALALRQPPELAYELPQGQIPATV